MRKTSLLLLNLLLSCVLAFGADRSWDFSTWKLETVSDMATDDTNWTYKSATRYSNETAIAAGVTIVANGNAMEELIGLTFGALAKDKLRIDHGTVPAKILLNGSGLVLNIPDCTAGDIIEITFQAAGSTDGGRGFSATTNVTGENNYADQNSPISNTYTVTADGTASFSTSGGLQIFEVSVKEYVASTPTISLQSGSADQFVYLGSTIESIEYKIGGTATDAAVTWTAGSAPEGIVVSSLTDDVITISGTPTDAGTYEYSIVSSDASSTSPSLTGTLTVVDGTGFKKVAYVTDLDKTMDEPILNTLKNSYLVETVDATAESVDYSGYDVIVLSAAPGSTAAQAMALANFAKPFVNLKVWMFRSDKWNWGASDNLGETPIVNTIVVEDASHAVFDGMSLSDGAQVVMATASSTSNRILIPVSSWNTGNETNITNLATVTGSTASDGNVVIGEITKDSSMSGTDITQNNIFIGVSEAAYGYLTADFLAIVKNSVDYVLGKTVSIEDAPAADAANKTEVAAEYYDLMGRVISGTPKGIVIKKSIYEDGSVSFGKAYIK